MIKILMKRKKLKVKIRMGKNQIERKEDGFNPYAQGRIELKKKKMKEGLDNKFSNEFYRKASAKHMKNKGLNQYEEGEEGYEESEGQF